MKNTMKQLVACVIITIMALTFISGCEKKAVNGGAIVDTIYIGHHYQPEDDPFWVSEVTGEPVMAPAKIKAAVAALETVKETLGVDIKWKQWPNGVTQDCLQTVLAGDPYAHIAILSNGFQGRIMVQNVLQPLDGFMDIFEREDYKWLRMTQTTFNHHYLLNRDLLYITDWPMVYNATMLEQIPELKEEDGTIVYPVELYERGEWTWEKFRWYLETVQNYYNGRTAPSGKEIVPYDARYQYTAIQAIHSNGGYLFNGKGMNFSSPQAVEAAEYLDSLMQDRLVNCVTAKFGSSTNPGYLESVDAFSRGEAVFTNCARWKMYSSSVALAERGESMGIIFFPRPDDVDFKEYNNEIHNSDYGYKIAISCADSVGLLRGFSEEESRLALEAYAMYRTEFYKNYGGVSSIKEYRETMAATEATSFGVDIFHDQIGDKNLEMFKLLGSLSENEFGEAMNIIWAWGVDIFGRSVYGVGGASKYATYVKATEANIDKSLNNIAEALKSEGASDTTQPNINQLVSGTIAFEKGTNPATIDWTKYFEASDNVDGKYEIKQDKGKIYIKPNPTGEEEEVIDEATGIEITKKKEYDFIADKMFIDCEYEYKVNTKTGSVEQRGIDFNKAGKYDKGITVRVTDSQGNTRESIYAAYVYDAENTIAPTLVLKDESEIAGKTIKKDTLSETIKWSDYVKEAKDAGGMDIISRVSADVSSLDLTEAGKYPVTIYVTDFTGKNRAEQEVTIEVVK